ncbi:unnamed protein product [Mytilus edulis]|uniref:Uncharacterized protein n=1 Tax=Mytilus edulis TaxID=6550 RepID=A0A8S3UDE2_MYTED|nr:unnamed protein product [Mytilus edulis]
MTFPNVINIPDGNVIVDLSPIQQSRINFSALQASFYFEFIDMDMSANFKDDEPNRQAVVRFCRGIISVAQFELALQNREQLEESILVAESREAELAKELGSMIPKRSGKIIAVNPFITRNFINFKYRETIQPSVSQKQNGEIEKGERIKTKKETKLVKKRVKEEEIVFKKYLKVNRRKKIQKKARKRNKKKLKKEQKERARLEKKEMKDRKTLQKEMKKKEGSKEKKPTHVINMPVVLEHMDIAMKKSDVDFKDDGKGNLNNEEKKTTIGKRLQDLFRSLICTKK